MPAPMSGTLSEPGAGLFPLALGAPLVSVFHAVDLAALFGIAPRASNWGLGRGTERLGA